MSKKIRKVKKPNHYTKNKSFMTYEEFLESTREVTLDYFDDSSQPDGGGSFDDIYEKLEEQAISLGYVDSFDSSGFSIGHIEFRTTPGYDYYGEYFFVAPIRIGDMKADAVQKLWSEQEKRNKAAISSYEKRFAKWKKWDEEFGEKVRAQEAKALEEKLNKEKERAEKALRIAQGKIDRINRKMEDL